MITLVVILSVVALVTGDVDPGPQPPCPSDNSVIAYFATNDCTKFWQCSNGVPYLMPCAPGTHWSQELWTCVHIAQSTCTGEGWSTTTQAPSTTTTTTPRPTTTTTTTTTPKPTTTTTTTTTPKPTTTTTTTTTPKPTTTTTTTTTPKPTTTTTTTTTPKPTTTTTTTTTPTPTTTTTTTTTPKPTTTTTTTPKPTTTTTTAKPTTTTTTTTTPKPTTTTTTTTTEKPTTTTEAPTTEAPTNAPTDPVLGVCPAVDGPDSVYFPDPDCTKFWQCSNGVAYQHSCSADLHFNPVLNVCDYPYRAGCEGTPTTQVPTTTAEPETTTEEAIVTTEADVDTTKSEEVTTESAAETTSSEAPGICPPADGANCADSVYFPDPDCTKFWQCSNGVPYQHTCPAGLHFNPILNVCDFPDRAGCIITEAPTTTEQATTTEAGDEETTTESAAETTTSEATTTEAVGEETEVTTESAAETTTSEVTTTDAGSGESETTTEPVSESTTPYEDDESTTSVSVVTTTETIPNTTPVCKPPPTQCTCTCEIVPDEDDEPTTTSIWTTTPSEAGHDTTIVEETSTTDASTTSNEDDGTTTEGAATTTANEGDETTTEGAETTTANEIDETTTEAATTVPSEGEETTTSAGGEVTAAPSICPPVDGADSIYFPDEDCTKFWQCSNGVAYPHTCPGGLHFNPVLNLCDWPDRAGCNGIASTEAPTTTQEPEATTTVEPEVTTEEAELTTEADVETTTAEVVTTTAAETTTTVKPKPEPEITTSAPSSGQASCDELSHQCPAVDGLDSVYIPLAECGGFCQCSNGRAYYQPCPPGLHFNPVLNVCDFPQRAGCTGISGTTSTTSATSPETAVPTVVPSTEAIPETEVPTTQAKPTDEPEPETTTEVSLPNGQSSCDELSNQCPAVDGPNSVYIPLAECTGFCQCSNGQAYYQPCPDDLHFNPVLNVCDYPYRAGCTGVSGTTSTTTANPIQTQPSPSEVKTPTTTSTTPPPTITTTTTSPSPTTTEPITSTEAVPAFPGDITYICAGKPSDVFLGVHPHDCGLYIACEQGESDVRPCPAGLHFSPTTYECVSPALAGCTPTPVDGTNSFSGRINRFFRNLFR